jgi:hypothetical protein
MGLGLKALLQLSMLQKITPTRLYPMDYYYFMLRGFKILCPLENILLGIPWYICLSWYGYK